MNTLLLRLSGPMQSWGIQSRFGMRDTEREPTKSGVIGMLAAALGRQRSEAVDDLAALRMGVRVDREGNLESDFQTAQAVMTAQGSIKTTEVSTRYYLAGAVFLVGLECADASYLATLHQALRSPIWMLYLGRRAFVPSPPVYLPDGLLADTTLMDALKRYPWRGKAPKPDRLRVVVDDPNGTQLRSDIPLSFSARTFATRRVKIDFIQTPDAAQEVM